MAKFAQTYIKSKDYERVLEVTSLYYKKFKLHLVEEKIGNRTGKYVTSPKSYSNLEDYENKEIEPYLQTNNAFTTNFDFYSYLKENSNWCVFVYPVRLAELTLNIDEEFTSLLSKELQTITFDYWEYTVVDQMLIRSFEKGESKDELYIAGGGEGEIDEMNGYFKKLEDYNSDKLEKVSEDKIQEKLDEKADIIDGFWNYIGFNNQTNELSHLNEKSRRPMYLKGNPEDIVKFLKFKDSTFYIV